MKHLTPTEAWQRLSPTSPRQKQKAKGTPPIPEVNEIGDIYVFRQEQQATITTAYEELPALIGEWQQGDGVMPDALSDMIEAYSRQVKAWAQNATDSHTADSLSSGSTAAATKNKAKAKAPTNTTRQDISPMVKSKWGQWEPFNDLCPEGCPAGCVAIAVAQIIWHWRTYHRGCTATKAYKTDTDKVKVPALPPITVFDYNNMSDNKPTNKKGRRAVAQLLQYVGAALMSDYRNNGTSALFSKAYHVLEDNIRLATKMGYEYEIYGAQRFDEKIYSSLKNGCPVIVLGTNNGHGAHAFIIDGYNAAKNLYHVNWGWYGQYDGYFSLNALTPAASYVYSYNKVAITNIKPKRILGDINGDGEVSVQDAAQAINIAINGNYDSNADIDSDGKVTVNDAQIIVNHITGKDSL